MNSTFDDDEDGRLRQVRTLGSDLLWSCEAVVAPGDGQRDHFQPAHSRISGYPRGVLKWLGEFFENFAHRAPHIPRPFNQLWEALGRTDPQAPSADDGDSDASSGS